MQVSEKYQQPPCAQMGALADRLGRALCDFVLVLSYMCFAQMGAPMSLADRLVVLCDSILLLIYILLLSPSCIE